MPRPDRLLDPPTWAPSWFPTVDGGASVRWLRRAIVVVLVTGVTACVSSGADSPADPSLGQVDVGVDVGDPDRATVCDTPSAEFGDETTRLLDEFGTATVTLATGDETVELCALVAATPEQRSRGLMTVTGFDGFDGMVFTYADDSAGPYYMLDTPTPLTIYWWTADGVLVSSAEMEPCLNTPAAECPRYPPGGPYRFALEVPLGALDDVVTGAMTLSVVQP